jgi:hypothetical protein
MESFTENLTLFWWYRLPMVAGRLTYGLAVMLTEGLYLTVWPVLAAFVPIIALTVGFLSGWLRFGGAELVFTQSILIMLLAIIFGFLSTQWGFLYIVAFGLADFVVYSNPALRFLDLGEQLPTRIAMLIMYVALGILAVGLPLFVQQLRAQLRLPSTMSADFHVIIDLIVTSLVSAILVYIYIQSLPMLIRPFFIWRRQSPPVNAVFPAQEQVWIFAVITLIVVVMRVLFEYTAAATDPKTMEAFIDLTEETKQLGLWGRIPKIVRIVFVSAVSTLFLAGLYASWQEAIIPFVLILLLGLLRWLLPKRFPLWQQIMERIPILFRLLIGLMLAYFLSSLLLNGRLAGSSFQPIVFALLLSLASMAIVFPEIDKVAEPDRSMT